MSDFHRLHWFWAFALVHHCMRSRCIATEYTAAQTIDEDHGCTTCLYDSNKCPNRIIEKCENSCGCAQRMISWTKILFVKTTSVDTHIENTSMKVISFVNGNCELNDNCIFFCLSMWPSVNHLACELINSSYLASIEFSYGTGFLWETQTRWRDGIRNVYTRYQFRLPLHLWLVVQWPVWEWCFFALKYHFAFIGKKLKLHLLWYNIIEFSNESLQTIPQRIIFVVLKHYEFKSNSNPIQFNFHYSSFCLFKN